MILVVGATGNLGSMIVKRICAQRHPVRALVREGSAYEEVQKAGAAIAFGDLKEPDTLRSACEDVKQVVSTATAVMRGGADTIESVDHQGTSNLIDAAKNANVEQFVYVSAVGFGPESSVPLARAKGLSEVKLKESGLTYSILKPVNFMESWIGFVLGSQLAKGPSVTILGDGRVKHGFVASENVADLAVTVLGHPQAQNAVIPLNGPGSFSYREIIKMIERATGQTIAIHSVDAAQPLPGFPPFVSDLWRLLIEMGDLTLNSEETAQTYGIKLVHVEDFIQTMFETLS
ncbi:MAG: SDR family oxidoreductase [bacterium]